MCIRDSICELATERYETEKCVCQVHVAKVEQDGRNKVLGIENALHNHTHLLTFIVVPYFLYQAQVDKPDHDI